MGKALKKGKKKKKNKILLGLSSQTTKREYSTEGRRRGKKEYKYSHSPRLRNDTVCRMKGE